MNLASQEVRQVIKFTHESVFHLQGVDELWGQPLEISHSFDPGVTIERLGSQEIIYMVTDTTMLRFFWSGVRPRGRHAKRRRSSQ